MHGLSNPFSLLRSLLSPGSRLAATLQAYFRSGWAFFMPYLAAYLLYAWLKWPVNPCEVGTENTKNISVCESVVSGQWSIVPPLLHAYWFLHGVHTMLAGMALWHWWRNKAYRPSLAAHRLPRTAFRPLPTNRHPLLATVTTALPWFCFAILFLIPGAYLEFPADPWAHFSRINEWSARMYIADHSAGQKVSYLLAYSLFGFLKYVPLELVALDVFHTTVCLLLTWQYYRLARATELQTAPSLIFAILSTVTLGNNIFGFYRYYGISSSAFAQIGFLAGTRCLLIFSNRWIAYRLRKMTPSAILGTLVSLGLTCVLAAMNHLQALGLIALSAGAIGMWTLVAKFGKMALATITSLTVLAGFGLVIAFEHEAKGTWFNAWCGFAFLSGGPATFRAMEIFGTVGLMNLIAGVLLLRRNHVAGWLTVFPALALFTPIFALPLTLGLQSVSSIEMFNRMLLAIPVPLALVWLANSWFRPSHKTQATSLAQSEASPRWKPAYPLTLLGLAFLTTAPASYPNFNRFFNSLERSNIATGWQTFPAEVREVLASIPREQPMFGPPNARFASDSFGLTALLHTSRDFVASRQVEETARTIPHVHDFNPAAGLLLVRPTAATVPMSYAGYLSRHWPPQALAFDSAGYPELRRLAEAQHGSPVGEGNVQLFRFRLR